MTAPLELRSHILTITKLSRNVLLTSIALSAGMAHADAFTACSVYQHVDTINSTNGLGSVAIDASASAGLHASFVLAATGTSAAAPSSSTGSSTSVAAKAKFFFAYEGFATPPASLNARRQVSTSSMHSVSVPSAYQKAYTYGSVSGLASLTSELNRFYVGSDSKTTTNVADVTQAVGVQWTLISVDPGTGLKHWEGITTDFIETSSILATTGSVNLQPLIQTASAMITVTVTENITFTP